ncbi:hypothetical protein Tco_0390704 [Tanacetum coccineum]
MIAPSSSRYSSNDMVHNHYLEEAKKKTQESSRNSRHSVMPSTRSQSTDIEHRFSIKKTSTVHEKTTSPRYCLMWKQTGRIFKTVGLSWVPTGKIFTFSPTKVDSEPPHGSNIDITNLHECIQNLNLSAGTTFNLKKERIKACIKENVISRRPRLHG